MQLPETRPFPKSPPLHTHLASSHVSQSAVIIQLQIHVCAQSLQPCPNQCVPMDGSPPGFSVHGMLHATILEWVVLPSSRRSFWPRDQTFIPGLLCVLNWQMGSIPPESPGSTLLQIYLTGNALQACLISHPSKTTKIWSELKNSNKKIYVKTNYTQGICMPPTSSATNDSKGESLILSGERGAPLPAWWSLGPPTWLLL